MSLTAPSHASICLGKCVVCGIETATKCSACAKSGTDWMFFCSTDHQKLIWSTHKRVCGVRSNPYRWPGLSSKEIEEFLEVCMMPIRPFTYQGTKVEKLLDLMLKDNPPGIPLEAQLAAVQERFETFRESAADQEQPLSLEKTRELVNIRSNAFAYSTASRDYLKSGPVQPEGIRRRPSAMSPFDVLAHCQGFLDSDLPRNPHFASWWSEFQHRHLIYFSLLNESAKKPSDHEIWECLSRSKRDLIKFCESFIKPTHPELAEKIIGCQFNLPSRRSVEWAGKRKEKLRRDLDELFESLVVE